MKKSLLVSIMVIFSLVIASCGSSEDLTLQQKAQQGNEEGLKAASQLIVEGIVETDGVSVFTQISRACKSSTTQNGLNQRLRTTKNTLQTFVRVDLADIKVAGVSVSNFSDSQSGAVKVDLDVLGRSGVNLESYIARQAGEAAPERDSQEINEEEVTFSLTTEQFNFIYEDGAWRLNDCEKLLDLSSLLSQTGS